MPYTPKAVSKDSLPSSKYLQYEWSLLLFGVTTLALPGNILPSFFSILPQRCSVLLELQELTRILFVKCTHVEKGRRSSTQDVEFGYSNSGELVYCKIKEILLDFTTTPELACIKEHRVTIDLSASSALEHSIKVYYL